MPSHIEPTHVEAFLAEVPGVTAVHDFHIWVMSTTETVMTVHLVTPAGGLDDGRLASITASMKERFSIGHCTIQLEHGDDAHPCAQAPASIV